STMGRPVADLVEALSKISRASYHSSEESRANHMRQMILSTTRDIRVILILLADRLQLLKTFGGMKPSERQAVARETMMIYAPIASRLGIHFFKSEMEDLAFQELEPEACRDLQTKVEQRLAARRERIERINRELTALLAGHQLQGEVLGRTKHLYSIYTKLQKSRLELDQIYDLLASRIILDTNEDCYRALGLIHAAYTPIPGRFKDYIALAKENGYQSLHTTVFGKEGDIFEIQIRTREMHNQADFGIAAHFAYKSGTEPDTQELANLAWFRRLLDNLEGGRDPSETLALMTLDLEPEHLFVFTPTGEVIKLPPKATPIDFAYMVHTEVGSHCIGAKMDGRMIPIRTPLKNGAVVEILTSGKQQPHKDWLKYAHTSKAISKIKNHLRLQEEIDAAKTGRERFARMARKTGKKAEDVMESQGFQEWMKRHNIHTSEELYSAEGFGKINLEAVLEKLYPGTNPAQTAKTRPEKRGGKPVPGKSQKNADQVFVAGLSNILVRFAKCCSPVYGDPLVGIITRGRGVSIHRQGCPIPSQSAYVAGRLVEVEWVGENSRRMPFNLVVHSAASAKALPRVGKLLEEEGTAIQSGTITTQKGFNTQRFTVLVNNTSDIRQILQRLNALEGIRAERDSEPALLPASSK
ncbi:MAG: RelA/SpoT family protein, partial [Deltaproteobacteria bacterium]|nr:RelA/SpoT family protein [Deltaproteobacteria bacterium]